MGSTLATDWLFPNERGFSVVVSSKVRREPNRNAKCRGVCLSADGAAIRANGELRTVRFDVYPGSPLVSATLGSLGR